MVSNEQLKDLLSYGEFAPRDKLFICLAAEAGRPKTAKEIFSLASAAGLRSIKVPNIGYLLSHSNGYAVKTEKGWELTTPGQKYVDKLLAQFYALGEYRNEQADIIKSDTKLAELDVFISHSSQDASVAEALITLLRTALNIPPERIRCTSVPGYQLPAGATTEDQLRREIRVSKTFIGLITPASIESTYVLFELGARWGAELHLAPIFASGATTDDLHGPLQGLNVLNCESEANIHQLVGEIGSILGLNASNPSVYLKQLEALTSTSRRSKKRSKLKS